MSGRNRLQSNTQSSNESLRSNYYQTFNEQSYTTMIHTENEIALLRHPPLIYLEHMLIPVEPSLPALPVRQDAPDQPPELRPMRAFIEVTEVVGDRVFEHWHRREDELPVEIDDAVGSAGAQRCRRSLIRTSFGFSPFGGHSEQPTSPRPAGAAASSARGVAPSR